MVDDLIDTAGTITEAAKILIKFGAKEVYALATHGMAYFQARQLRE